MLWSEREIMKVRVHYKINGIEDFFTLEGLDKSELKTESITELSKRGITDTSKDC